MTIVEAVYTASYPKVSMCPPNMIPEYAFIGRSNVGKSSLINMLCDRKDLARTSKKPGKTQMLNYFIIDKAWNIVDLPGYGYAKRSKSKRDEWRKMIEGYLQKRQQLMCAFILLDSNIPPQKIDMEFLNWLGQARVPFAIVYTKTDKLSKDKLESNLNLIRSEILKTWETLPQEFITSSNKRTGKKEILSFIGDLNANF